TAVTAAAIAFDFIGASYLDIHFAAAIITGMKTAVRISIAAALCTALSITVLAQWTDYRWLPVPTTPDGKPDMNAPTPRTADGKPDLSGTWRGFNPNAGRRGAPPPPPAGTPPIANFRDIQTGFEGGLPLTPFAK